MDFSNEAPLVINTFFHDTDSEIPILLTEEDFLSSIAYLNRVYNPFRIFFKYRGFDTNTTAVDNMLNIYTRNDNGGVAFNGTATVNYLSFIEGSDTRFILAHEVGHLFCLIHTVNAESTSIIFTNPLTCNQEIITEGTYAITGICAENVTRDPNNPDYNAQVTGDYVVDTPASYEEVNLCVDTNTTPPTLEYLFSNEVVDAVGTPYQDIDVANIMDTDTREIFFSFKNNFTDGQGIRMRESIENRALLQSWLAPVSSLYEPYSGSYYFAGPIVPDNRPLFQPGFDYKFVRAGGLPPNYNIYNTPSDYDDISFSFDTSVVLNKVDRFSLDLNNINHPNRSAIIIEQLEQQPRKCYHNVNRGASGGKVIKFNDNTPNANYTVYEKDSIGINHPTLIQDLDNGLYIIEKDYDDGTQEQKTILKSGTHE